MFNFTFFMNYLLANIDFKNKQYKAKNVRITVSGKARLQHWK